MRPTDPHERPEPTALDRREFLRLGGTLAAASALATTGCQPPQEATIPFHDMPESLADGLGRARFYRTVLAGSPVQVTTREGRPILVAPPPDDRSGRGVALRHQAAIMDLYDPDRARHPLAVRRGQGAPRRLHVAQQALGVLAAVFALSGEHALNDFGHGGRHFGPELAHREQAAHLGVEENVDRRIESLLARMNIPSKSEIETLSEKISILSGKVDELTGIREQ